MIAELITQMAEYFQDPRLTEHALQVHGYAMAIGGESLDASALELLSIAAILHDIGIPEAIQRHGSAAGEYQEQEGQRLVPSFLEKHHIPQDAAQRVAWLVGHHHSPQAVAEDPLLQLLLEADALVNLSGTKPDLRAKAYQHLFQTKAGKRLFRALYPKEASHA